MPVIFSYFGTRPRYYSLNLAEYAKKINSPKMSSSWDYQTKLIIKTTMVGG